VREPRDVGKQGLGQVVRCFTPNGPVALAP
jgi:hypothetical protein